MTTIQKGLAAQGANERNELQGRIANIVQGASVFKTPVTAFAALSAVSGGVDRQSDNAARMMAALSPEASPELIKATAMVAQEGFSALETRDMMAFRAMMDEQKLAVKEGIAHEAMGEVGRASTGLGACLIKGRTFVKGLLASAGLAKDISASI